MKITSSNIQYLNFIKNNHNMIQQQKQLLDISPNKNSKPLVKSFSLRQDKQNQEKYDDKLIKVRKQQQKKHGRYEQNKNIQDPITVNRNIYNSLNHFKHSYQTDNLMNKQRIIEMIQSKNRQIRQDLQRSKPNLSEVIYKGIRDNTNKNNNSQHNFSKQKVHSQSLQPSSKQKSKRYEYFNQTDQGSNQKEKDGKHLPAIRSKMYMMVQEENKRNSNMFKNVGTSNLINFINSNSVQSGKQLNQTAKMYKKVQRNNKDLNIRPINKKILKSYYDYENAILIREELFKMSSVGNTTTNNSNNKLIGKLGANYTVMQQLHKQIVGQEYLLTKMKQQQEIRSYLEGALTSRNLIQNNPIKNSNSLIQKQKSNSQLGNEVVIFQEILKEAEQQNPITINTNEQQNKGSLSTLNKNKKIQNTNQINAKQQNLDITIYQMKMRSYRQFLFMMNMVHGKFSPLVMKQSINLKADQKYKFYVGKGNNSLLIKSLMKRRFWWTIQEDPKKANFVWTQLKIMSFYQFQKKPDLNKRFYKEEINSQFTEQKKIRRKIQQKSPSKGVVFKAPFPLENQFKIMTAYDHIYFTNFLQKTQNSQKMQNFKKRLSYFSEDFFQQILQDNAQTQRLHNHLEFNHFIGNKKALFYNLKTYYELMGKDVFQIIPLTFHVKKGAKDPQFARFLHHYKKIQAEGKEKKSTKKQKQKKQKNLWIVKPGQNSNRGSGITVFDQLYEINNIFKKKQKHQNGQQKTYIIQKYLQRPLLYKNRKFDIRHYMLITRLHGKMRVYWFGQGYIRTSSYTFDLNDVDTQIHLTNDAIQKHCDTYGKYQQGNKISYNQLQKYVNSLAKQNTKQKQKQSPRKQKQKQSFNFGRDIYPQMKRIALDAVKSCYTLLDPNKTLHNFEIFGLDFMIDANLKVWLIQVNTNPCLQLSAKLLQRIIPTMVQHSLRLSLDVIFPPPCQYPNSVKHLIPDTSLEKLQYELIFDEDRDGRQLQQLFKNLKTNQMGDVDQDDEVYENDGKQLQIDLDD